MDLNQLIANNDAIRYAIVQNAMPMAQPQPPISIAGNVTVSNNIVTLNPRLVGLLCGLLVQVDCTFTNSGANIGQRTELGAANIIDRIVFTDLNNVQRHNAKGFAFALLNSAKMGGAYGGAVAPNLPMNAGAINTVQSLPATIAAGGGTAAGRMFYWIPIAYNMLNDLRGAIWAQVTNAQYQLQITLNASPGEAAGDQLNKVYDGLAAAANLVMSAVTINVTQVYYDQLPRINGETPLPYVDLSWNYQFRDTTWTGLTANQDNTFPFANYQTFLSTLLIYDNAGVYNAGTDVNYWELRYANSTQQWRKNPNAQFLDTRNQIGYDFPLGTYYLDHRNFPIATATYGNCDLVFNPSAVGANALVYVNYETFQQNNTLRNASSLPQGS